MTLAFFCRSESCGEVGKTGNFFRFIKGEMFPKRLKGFNATVFHEVKYLAVVLVLIVGYKQFFEL